ncbi:MAG: hypothetical protein WDA16_05210 [Candidatus Thermoplasmatota archaeon]
MITTFPRDLTSGLDALSSIIEDIVIEGLDECLQGATERGGEIACAVLRARWSPFTIGRIW